MSDVVGYRVAMPGASAPAALRDRVQQLLAPVRRHRARARQRLRRRARSPSRWRRSSRASSASTSRPSSSRRATSSRRRTASSIVGDATALPFEYGSFDIAGCMRVLHHARRPELVVSELARVTRPGGADPPRRPARVRRPGRLGRDRPVRAGARPVPHAAAARPGHPLPARRQRPRRADERDHARAARPRALPRPRRSRGRRAAARQRHGARRRLRGRDRLVRRAQARRARPVGARPVRACRWCRLRLVGVLRVPEHSCRERRQQRLRDRAEAGTGTTGRRSPPCPARPPRAPSSRRAPGRRRRAGRAGWRRTSDAGSPGVVTNPGRIVCTSMPDAAQRGPQRPRERHLGVLRGGVRGSRGEHDRAADRGDVGDVRAPVRSRRLPQPVEQAPGHPDAAEVVDRERPLDELERRVDEGPASEDAGAVDEQVDGRVALEDARRRLGDGRPVGDVAELELRHRSRSRGARSTSSRRATSTQCQPWLASSRAVASPMPDDAPVTTATRRGVDALRHASGRTARSAFAWNARLLATSAVAQPRHQTPGRRRRARLPAGTGTTARRPRCCRARRPARSSSRRCSGCTTMWRSTGCSSSCLCGKPSVST